VTQWCNDWYNPDYFSRSPVDDPTGPASGTIHVIRGGCWLNDAQYCRSANRYYTEIPKWCCLHGFRVVCEVQ
jgi:formylglycine-generating enzyme required for sulfatase activity